MDDLALPPTAMALLGVLAEGVEVSGYELRQWAAHTVGHWYTTPAQSQVYRELSALHEAGLVTSRPVEQTGKPDKVVHAITDAGRQALAAWVAANPPKPMVLKHHSMLRLFLGGDAEPAQLRKMVGAHRAHVLAALDDLETQSVALGADGRSDYQAAVAEWAAEIYRGDLQGTELALKALEQRIVDSSFD